MWMSYDSISMLYDFIWISYDLIWISDMILYGACMLLCGFHTIYIHMQVHSETFASSRCQRVDGCTCQPRDSTKNARMKNWSTANRVAQSSKLSTTCLSHAQSQIDRKRFRSMQSFHGADALGRGAAVRIISGLSSLSE